MFGHSHSWLNMHIIQSQVLKIQKRRPVSWWGGTGSPIRPAEEDPPGPRLPAGTYLSRHIRSRAVWQCSPSIKPCGHIHAHSALIVLEDSSTAPNPHVPLGNSTEPGLSTHSLGPIPLGELPRLDHLARTYVLASPVAVKALFIKLPFTLKYLSKIWFMRVIPFQESLFWPHNCFLITLMVNIFWTSIWQYTKL